MGSGKKGKRGQGKRGERRRRGGGGGIDWRKGKNERGRKGGDRDNRYITVQFSFQLA